MDDKSKTSLTVSIAAAALMLVGDIAAIADEDEIDVLRDKRASVEIRKPSSWVWVELPIQAAQAGAGGSLDPQGSKGKPAHEKVPYVSGLENPTEGSVNIIRWLVKHGYSDDEIARVMGGNALRILRQVWV